MFISRSSPSRIHHDTAAWTIHAPAKLNLGLRVFPPRPDGFHDLESWFVPLSFHDTLRFTPDGPLTLTLCGRSVGIPTDLTQNLVGRAALRLANHAGIKPFGYLELHKVVPPGGGLGGGSSDAANALLLLNRAWQCHLDRPTLLALAAELGSDVPFFLHGRPSLCTGRGEQIAPLPLGQPLFAVLLIPEQGIGTKGVYQAFDTGHRYQDMPPTRWRTLPELTARDLNNMLINDLEPAALAIAPWLAELQEKASDIIDRKIHMTGSGSTLFTLCATAPEAVLIADRLQAGLGASIHLVPTRVLRH